MATKTRTKTGPKKVAGSSADAARDLHRAEVFRVNMTELAETLDRASRAAASLLHSYPDQVDYHSHADDLHAVRASAAVFAGVLRSGGCAG